MYTFTKKERLKSKKIIGRLFNKEGSSFAIYPLRVIWLKIPLDSSFPAQFTVSVPKRKFKIAAHRNRIRRQIKEAYRLNKHILYKYLEEEDMQIAFMILYTGKEAISYQEIEQKVVALLHRFARRKRGGKRKK